MPSRIIPKERLFNYQRWEMDAFESTVRAIPESCDEKQDDPGESGVPVILPTVEQIERIHQQAQQEGHAAGYDAGFKAGHADGRQAGDEQAAADAVKLQGLLQSFQR